MEGAGLFTKRKVPSEQLPKLSNTPPRSSIPYYTGADDAVEVTRRKDAKHGDVINSKNSGNYAYAKFYVEGNGWMVNPDQSGSGLLSVPIEVAERLHDVRKYYNNFNEIISDMAVGPGDVLRKELFTEIGPSSKYYKHAMAIAQRASIYFYPDEGKVAISYNKREWFGPLKMNATQQMDVVRDFFTKSDVSGMLRFSISYIFDGKSETINALSKTYVARLFPSKKWKFVIKGSEVTFKGPQEEQEEVARRLEVISYTSIIRCSPKVTTKKTLFGMFKRPAVAVAGQKVKGHFNADIQYTLGGIHEKRIGPFIGLPINFFPSINWKYVVDEKDDYSVKFEGPASEKADMQTILSTLTKTNYIKCQMEYQRVKW